jgi:hypothetical protein
MSKGENEPPLLLDYATPQPHPSSECNWGEGKRWTFAACLLVVIVPLAFAGCAVVFGFVARL